MRDGDFCRLLLELPWSVPRPSSREELRGPGVGLLALLGVDLWWPPPPGLAAAGPADVEPPSSALERGEGIDETSSWGGVVVAFVWWWPFDDEADEAAGKEGNDADRAVALAAWRAGSFLRLTIGSGSAAAEPSPGGWCGEPGGFLLMLVLFSSVLVLLLFLFLIFDF